MHRSWLGGTNHSRKIQVAHNNKTEKEKMRWDIINSVIMAINAESYLEIGTQYGDTFTRILPIPKIGVDPDLTTFKERRSAQFSAYKKADILYEMTSDKFFESYNSEGFDVVFIDGLHKCEQVQKDLVNALEILNDGGVIVLHDTMPSDARYATPGPTLISKSGNSLWCGDTWRIFSYLDTREDLNYWTVDEDYGCTVVVKQPKEYTGGNIDNWNYYYANRLKVGKVTTIHEIVGKLNERI